MLWGLKSGGQKVSFIALRIEANVNIIEWQQFAKIEAWRTT